MAGGSSPSGEGRYLVVTADDFGRSPSVNRAIAIACDRGVLTAASIVAGGDAFAEAVDLAARYPKLSVGLHIMLSDGRPVLPPADTPGLVDTEGRFERSPMRAGVTYWRLRRSLADQIGAEVKAQFDRVEEAGIQLTHVDCHHHLHMHPLLFEIIATEAARRGVAWIRIPREPLSLVLGLHVPLLDVKAFFTRLVFGLLAARNLRVACRHGLRAADNVYGLSGTGRIDEKYLLALLPYVKGATSEIYLHPDLGSSPGRGETKGATSKRVRDRLKTLGLHLVGFRELSGQPLHVRPAMRETLHCREDSIAHAHR
jgi:hopanoid biosynthesis associated protein HpnK